MKDVLTPKQMRACDLNTEENGIPTLTLMENAGFQITQHIINNYPDKKRVSIYSGVGGNGGDGFVVARLLLNHGYKVHLKLLARPENIKNKDSITNWKALNNCLKADTHLKISIIRDSKDISPDNADIIVDAILGTGVNGKIREPISSAIDTINYSPAIILSVDVPSGLDPLTGEVFDKCVIAHNTLTLHKPKTGLTGNVKQYIGELNVLDIGIPRVSELFVGKGDLIHISSPQVSSHKGENGSVLIVGSNSDYIGAVVFAAESALKMNVDLVYIIAPSISADVIKSYNPNFIVKSVEGNLLRDEHFDEIMGLVDKVDSVLIGSGAGLSEDTAKLFNRLVQSIDKVMVLDADALKLVDKENIVDSKTIVTPHAREFETFFKKELPENDDKKIELLSSLSREYNTVITLKGVYDIITSPDDYKLNSTGNQGMTVGGTGDVLAGITVALACKCDVFTAAYLATYIIGTVADEVFKSHAFNYTSKDLLDSL